MQASDPGISVERTRRSSAASSFFADHEHAFLDMPALPP